ncbi:MAG: 16S rRNA (guanine(966)-N(2))-methyltransferase RsmD [Clostridia bacterium]|nr:16S rRNA (guanine(966)-N(2))-methyltransferase RsmD [Clostridia bacterium]
MRVITGTARGCRLKTLEGENTRPTAERVKEGIFSALCFEIEGRRVLDLFAGSGQMGIEALSRGAKSCVFVDSSREAVEVVRQNLRTTGLESDATVLCRDSQGFLSQTDACFDLVFLDPPYASNLILPCLEQLDFKTTPAASVVCETDKETVLPDTIGDWYLHRLYRYGRVVVRVYRKKEQESL